VSVARATRNGTARRTVGEWGRLLEDRDRWRTEALEAERALAATTAELADALALAAQLDTREGPRDRRVVFTDSAELTEQRKSLGRRQIDHEWQPEPGVGQWRPRVILCADLEDFRPGS
jgi:hypothetical protein